MSYKAWLEQRYYEFRAYVPARWLYHADYFRVRRLLAGSQELRHAAATERLRHVLGVAAGFVPYYKRSVRLSADELANEDPWQLLLHFPYLGKAQVMDCQREFLDERLDPSKLNYATSGGSTGQGIGVWRSKRLADIEKAFFTHAWARYGFSFDKARYLRIGADARRRAHESPTRVAGNRLLLSPYHITARHKAAIVAAINRFQPAFVHAYPSSAAALAELLGPGELALRVRAVLLASEPATEQQLALIGRLFDCPVSINYGLTERTNLAFASHYHGVTGPYRFEPLYGVNQNREVGGRAEIVGTSLWNDVMPLIRYCTEDFGAIGGAGVCPLIEGREQDFLLDRSGNRIPGLSIVIDEATWDFVRLYQVRQRWPGAITICVVARRGSLSEEQKKFVLGAQQRRWGGLFDIGLEEVADIPLAPSGKRQLVVNQMRAQAPTG
jgi:phenylacetate-CoA ligase